MHLIGNFNGAIFSKSSMAGIGVVIRDSNGLIIAAMSQKLSLPNSVVFLKLLQLVQQFSLPRILVCIGSNLRLILLWSTRLWERADLPSLLALHGNIIEETKLLACSLQWFNFKYVKRVGNCLAHAPARRVVYL